MAPAFLGTRQARGEGDYERHVDYINYNPVKHGHMTKVANWPYTKFALNRNKQIR